MSSFSQDLNHCITLYLLGRRRYLLTGLQLFYPLNHSTLVAEFTPQSCFYLILQIMSGLEAGQLAKSLQRVNHEMVQDDFWRSVKVVGFNRFLRVKMATIRRITLVMFKKMDLALMFLIMIILMQS